MASDISTFPLSGPINLLARLGHGSITVTAQDDLAEAVVRLIPRDPRSDVLDRTTVKMQGSTLLVTGPRQGGLADLVGGWRRERDGIDAAIEVPSGTPIKISSAGDDIMVTGRCGDADIATSAARIKLDVVAGHLRLRNGNADSRIVTVTGSVQLSAGGGSAQFGEIGGPLDCKFGSGEFSAAVLHGDLHLRAGRASAHLGAVHGDVDVAIGSGPISIGLPAGVAAELDITSGMGLVHTDLPVEQAPAPAHQMITVRVRTGAGDVQLLRAAA
jgi:hypothetical protein